MGTGKSAVGRQLADLLGWRFFDTDKLIEQETKTSIAQIFADKGEAFFREQEKQVIARVSKERNVVIATGGGAMVNKENVACLRENSDIICLTATPAIILERVRSNRNRPLLQGDNPLVKIRTLLAARAEAYAQADVTIDTSRLDVQGVVKTILERLTNRRNATTCSSE